MSTFVRADAADEVGVFQLADVPSHASYGKSRRISQFRQRDIWHRLHDRQDFLVSFLVSFLDSFLVSFLVSFCGGNLVCLALGLERPQNLVEHEVDERPALAGGG